MFAVGGQGRKELHPIHEGGGLNRDKNSLAVRSVWMYRHCISPPQVDTSSATGPELPKSGDFQGGPLWPCVIERLAHALCPCSSYLENGPHEFNAGFGQYGNFIVDASGGVQNWEISTKSKVLHNALFWGGAGVSLVGCIAALATLNSTGNTAMDFALIGGVGGLAVMSIGVLVPPIRILQE